MSEVKKATQLRDAGEKLKKAQEKVRWDSERYKKAVRDNCGVNRVGIDLKYSTEALRRAQNEYSRLK